MNRTDTEEAVVDKDSESALRQNQSSLSKHRHLARAAHVVTSIACAIGSAFIPHFLQHKPFVAPAPAPEQLSLRSDRDELLSKKTSSSSELGSQNNGSNSLAQESGNDHDGRLSSLLDANGRISAPNSLLPPAAPLTVPLTAPQAMQQTMQQGTVSGERESEGGAASPLARSPFSTAPGAVAVNPASQRSASFAVGNKLSSNAKIFTQGPSVKEKSNAAQSAEVSVDKANRRISIGQTLIKCSTDSKVFLSNAGTICLVYGDTLVDAKNPLLVRVGTDFVLVRKNATALITVRNGALKVRNLQEQHAFSTELAINNRPFTICAGEELVAASDFESLQSTLGSDGVTRRQVQTYELSDGTNVIRGEFAPITVIKHNEMLKAMCSSTDQTDSRLFSKMMKMAACIAVVTGSHGSYASVSSEPGNQQMAFSSK